MLTPPFSTLPVVYASGTSGKPICATGHALGSQEFKNPGIPYRGIWFKGGDRGYGGPRLAADGRQRSEERDAWLVTAMTRRVYSAASGV